ncbi:alpha-ribazole-5-phosphate synthase [Clostridium sp. SYSU_GA19001]|uniref:AIR synthase related protein n=1 Tax=Clostridium caldaquaticum TaxID=2940653 RepID=UPI002077254F|nr:AIR synthase related protein [Clostridium caldaquaticum]MCM8710055.1 alpha-ribazole-5-phosphate synthase [Clostridium caldaquaticum]
MEIRKIRDLSLIKLDDEKTMVIACDSCGGIGEKEADTFKVPPFYVGKLTARVSLIEVICSGAEIITVADAVCNEMEPTGSEIIRGIKEELKAAGIKDIVLTGSTEENMITNATGLGVTTIGIVNTKDLKVNRVIEEAIIICVGYPKVGSEINFVYDKEMVDYADIYKLLNSPFVYEIVPVGSKGIVYEAQQLALNNKLKLQFSEKIFIDINKSGGPATCVIAAIKPEGLEEISKLIENVNVIGSLKGITHKD